MNPVALVLTIISTIFFGTVTVYATKVSRKVGAVPALFLYQALGIPLFLLFVPIMPQMPTHFSAGPTLLLGALSTFAFILFYYSTTIGELPVVGTVNQLYLVVTTILGIWLLHEPFAALKILGFILVFIGIVLFSFKLTGREKKNIKLLRGVPHSFLSAVGIGVYLYFVAIFSRTNGWFLTALLIRVAISVTALIVMVIQRQNIVSILKQTPWKDAIMAAALDVIAFSLYNFVVGRYEFTSATIISATKCVITVVLANKLLGEHLTKRQIIGFCIILAGLISLQLK